MKIIHYTLQYHVESIPKLQLSQLGMPYEITSVILSIIHMYMYVLCITFIAPMICSIGLSNHNNTITFPYYPFNGFNSEELRILI